MLSQYEKSLKCFRENLSDELGISKELKNLSDEELYEILVVASYSGAFMNALNSNAYFVNLISTTRNRQKESKQIDIKRRESDCVALFQHEKSYIETRLIHENDQENRIKTKAKTFFLILHANKEKDIFSEFNIVNYTKAIVKNSYHIYVPEKFSKKITSALNKYKKEAEGRMVILDKYINGTLAGSSRKRRKDDV